VEEIESDEFAAVAHVFAGAAAKRAALVEQARSWTGVDSNAELGNFDTVMPTDGDQLGNIYARLVALSAQRLRVLSDQLARAYAAYGVDAFRYEKQIYNPRTEEVEVASEEVTVLYRLEAEERDRLERLLIAAVKLQLESRSAEAVAMQAQRQVAYVRSMAEAAGLSWADESTRRLAQRAVVRAEAELASTPGVRRG
jgi:hypothetical protein